MGKSLGFASALYAASILLSRVIGLVREAVIGRTLGNGAEADVYWTAFILPDFLNYLLAGGALSLVFIPIFQAYWAREDEAGAWRAFSRIAAVLGAVVVLATVGLWCATPWLTPLVAPGMSAAQHEQLVALVRILLPAQIFHVVGGLLSATLQARDRHAMPALAPLVYTLGVIIGGVALGPWLGAAGFAWGVLAGSILGPFGLPLWGARRAGLRWRLEQRWFDADVATYFRRSLPVMLGVSIVVFDDFILRRQGSLLDEGTISRLTYAKTLMRVPMGVFGLAAGMAAFPAMTRLFAEGRTGEGYGLIVRTVRLTLVLALTAQAALSVAGADIAAVIWGDRRFSSENLAHIGELTGWVCLGLWGWSVQGLYARGFYALGDTLTPTVVGSVVTLAAFPVYGALGASYGAPGLAVASSVAISLNAGVMSALLARRVGGGGAEPGLIDALWRLAIAVGVAVALGRWMSTTLPSSWPALVRAGLLSGGAALACMGVAAALGIGEVRDVARNLLTRARRIRARLT